MTAKPDALDAVSTLTDDSRLEDIMYRLNVLEKIHQADQDVAQGRIVSQQSLREEITGWLSGRRLLERAHPLLVPNHLPRH